MVQIIPKVRSFGEEFGRAIGAGAGAGLSSAYESNQKRKALAKENEDIFKETGIQLSSTDPEMRKLEFNEALKSMNEIAANQSFSDQLFGGGEQKTSEQKFPGIGKTPEQSQQKPQNPQQEQKKKLFSAANITDKQIIQAGKNGPKLQSLRESARTELAKEQKADKEFEERVREIEHVENILRESKKYAEPEIKRLAKTLDPASARQLLKTQTEPKPYESTADKLDAERTNEYIKSVAEKGQAAEEGMRGLETGMAIHSEGGTGFKFNNWLADYFKNPALADPKSKTFNALMKKEYNGIAATVGGKVSNFEFSLFQGRIAQAEDSPQAAESLMVASMMEKKIAIKEQEITEKLREQYYDKGENLPPNFDIIVKKELRPYADLIMRQTNDQLNDILNPTTSSRNEKNQQKLNEIWK